MTSGEEVLSVKSNISNTIWRKPNCRDISWGACFPNCTRVMLPQYSLIILKTELRNIFDKYDNTVSVMTHPPWHLLASSQCPQYKDPAVVTSLCRIVVLNTRHQAHFCCIFVACSNSSFLVQDHQPASPARLSTQPPPGKPTTASTSNSHFFLINQTPASQASSLPDSNTACENKDLTCFSGVSAVEFNLDFWQWGSVFFLQRNADFSYGCMGGGQIQEKKKNELLKKHDKLNQT